VTYGCTARAQCGVICVKFDCVFCVCVCVCTYININTYTVTVFQIVNAHSIHEK